jgi:hypothetical protein
MERGVTLAWPVASGAVGGFERAVLSFRNALETQKQVLGSFATP